MHNYETRYIDGTAMKAKIGRAISHKNQLKVVRWYQSGVESLVCDMVIIPLPVTQRDVNAMHHLSVCQSILPCKCSKSVCGCSCSLPFLLLLVHAKACVSCNAAAPW